ncbi:MAG: TonB-dependent receptor [Deltaproteobacteria bacterium]|nr:TonB-dependent receptor [Deltaproteobacteria bacterium]
MLRDRRQVARVVAITVTALSARVHAQQAADAGAPVAPVAPVASEIPVEPETPTQAQVPIAPPLARPSRARPTPAADDDDESGVTVVGRDLPRVASAVTVVDRHELRMQQPLSVSDSLRRQPGITTRDEDGFGMRPNISVRGLDGTRSRRVLLLEDGVPIALNPYGEPDAYYMPPVERIDGIEVIRGSGAILYGAQTIGGVVNLRSPNVPRRPGASVSLVGGAPGYFSAHAMAGGMVRNAGLMISAVRRQGVGFRNQGFDVTEVLAKLRVELGSRNEVLARVAVYDENSATTYLGLTQPMFDQNPWQNPAIYDRLNMRRYSASLSHTLRIAPGVRLQSVLFGYTTTRNWHRQLYDRIETYSPTLLYERIVGCNGDCANADPRGLIFLRNGNRNNDRAYEVYGAQSKLEATLRNGPVLQNIDAGVRVLAERANRRVFFGSAGYSRTGELDSDEQGDGVAFSLFAQDRVTLFDRLVITPGIRMDYYPYTRTTRRVGGADVFRRGSSVSWAVIPGVSAGYTVRWLTAFAGVNLGYAPPRVTVAIDPISSADRMLDAERSVNYEVGVRAERGRWLRAEATVFAIDFQNEIVAGSFAGGMPRTEFINGGQSRYLGAEGLVHLDLAKALDKRWSLYVDLRGTGVDARFVGGIYDNNHVPYAVPFSGNASLGFEHPLGLSAQVTGTLVSQHFTDRENTPIALVNGLAGPIPTYTTVDFSARYQEPSTGLGVTLSVKNILNQPYISSRLPEGIFPAGFTQLMIGLRWDRF